MNHQRSKAIKRGGKKRDEHALDNVKMKSAKSSRLVELEQLRRNTVGTLNLIDRMLAEEKASAKT
jgi:hypothetical protein